ncbi:MAG: hypothetical protein ACYC33_11220 [Thermoleophilia bacterium]
MDDFLDSLAIHHFLLNDQVREELVAAITAVLTQDDRIDFATLYGSANEGEEKRHVRDLDVALYLTDSALGQTFHIEQSLGSTLEAVVRRITGDAIPVDVRVYNETPLHAQFRALTGRILLIRDRDAFARVVEYVVPRHLDAEPLRLSALRDLVSPRGGS